MKLKLLGMHAKSYSRSKKPTNGLNLKTYIRISFGEKYSIPTAVYYIYCVIYSVYCMIYTIHYNIIYTIH